VNSCVLDASAVIAYLHQEPGCEVLEGLLDEAAISAVNLAEVATRLIDRGASQSEARKAIEDLEIETLPFGDALAYEVAALRSVTKHAGLSLGDRACLATAKSLGVRAITADRQWSRLRVGVQVQVIR
jgi:ribonuclease VapC